MLARSELLLEVKTDADGKASGSVLIDPVNFPFLKTISASFERIRWNAVHVEWRPAVGANTDGMVALGYDWAEAGDLVTVAGRLCLASLKAVERSSVLARTPNRDAPVWQSIKSWTIPAAKLQSRQWYVLAGGNKAPSIDRAPGSLMWAVSGAGGKTMGEVWVTYSVRLMGTTA